MTVDGFRSAAYSSLSSCYLRISCGKLSHVISVIATLYDTN